MIPIYVCLVILHLASTSCRNVDHHHDREEKNGPIAQFFLPLLGSDVKDDIEVEVVPYRDYKHKKKTNTAKKPFAGNGSALETKKKDSPLAVILANDKSKKSPHPTENTDGRRFLKLPFWESAEDKFNTDDSRSDSTIIIHVKRKKGEKVPKGGKAHAHNNKHKVISQESEESISVDSNSNEHVTIRYDDKPYIGVIQSAVDRKKIHNEHPRLYHAEVLESSKEISHHKQKQHDKHREHKNYDHHNNIKVVLEEKLNNQTKFEENIYNINEKSKTMPNITYITRNNLSYFQESLESKSSEEFEYGQISQKEIFNTSSNEALFITNETEESYSDDTLREKQEILEKPDVIVSSSNHTIDNKPSEEESIIESESSVTKESYELDNLQSDIQVHHSTVFDNLSSSQDVEVEQNTSSFLAVTHEHQNQDNSQLVEDTVDTSASSEKNINEIYHPNLHFEPYLIHKNPQNENIFFTKSLIEASDVPTNEALMKAYTLLFNKNNSDEKYDTEILPQHSKVIQQKEKNVKHVSNPEYDNFSEKVIHHSHHKDKSSDDTVIVKDINHKHDLDQLDYAKHSSENLTISEDEENFSLSEIIQRANVNDYGVNVIEYDTSHRSNEYKYSLESISGESEWDASSENESAADSVEINLKNHTLHEEDSLNNHIGPEIVLLSGGKIIKYEAPKNIKAVKTVGKKYHQSKKIDNSSKNIRNAGVHQFELNDNDSKITEESSESSGDTEDVIIAGDKYCQNDSNIDENNIRTNQYVNPFQGKTFKKYVNIIKNNHFQKKKPVFLPKDITNIKSFNKQLDVIASLVKKKTLLEAGKRNSGCKSYNLSFLFNKR